MGGLWFITKMEGAGRLKAEMEGVRLLQTAKHDAAHVVQTRLQDPEN